MSLIRESLKKVQEDDRNNKTTAALLAVPPANGTKKMPSSTVILICIGLVLISGAALFLYWPGPSKPVIPAAVTVPNPLTTAPGPSLSNRAAPVKPGADLSLPTSQGAPSAAGARSTIEGAAPAFGSLSGPGGRLHLPGKVSREPLREKLVEPAVMGPGSVAAQKAGRGKEDLADLVVQFKDKTGSAPRAKASSREVPEATRTGAGELQDSGGREALKQSYQQAYVWQQEGRTNQALARYREILAQDPYNPYVLTNLGLIYQQTGNLKEAISYYEKAIEADPGFVPAAQNLGVAWLTAGNSEEAARWLERSLALEPDNAPALVNLGILYKKRGNREKARHYFKKAWALNTRLPEASYNLARLEEEAGNIPEAWKYYQQFVRLRNDPNDKLVQDVQRHIQDWRVPETVQR
jgi:Tfp pilus assembly protein PilF